MKFKLEFDMDNSTFAITKHNGDKEPNSASIDNLFQRVIYDIKHY